uniref:Methyltransferase 23, arginine n=1 Tax=Petromyzon marinus TaxID=7757 RepID=S4RFC0_PETMA
IITSNVYNISNKIHFGQNHRRVCVQVLDPHYGMYVWPCSVVLAQFVWHNKALVRDQRMLELGAGTALPGIVAARCGATVTLSDLPRCLPSCAHSCRVNGLDGSVPVLGLRWGLVTPSLVTMPPLDIILGSDILYEPRVSFQLYFFSLSSAAINTLF